MTERLAQDTEIEEQGRPQLKITVADRPALTQLATALTKFLQNP
jgi:hypothetical protein